MPSLSVRVREAKAASIVKGEAVTPAAKCISGSQTECNLSSSARSTQFSKRRKCWAVLAPPWETPRETPSIPHASIDGALEEAGPSTASKVLISATV